MEAGYGAELKASRIGQRARQRRRDIAAAKAAGSAVDRDLERIQRQQRAWAQGAEGERQVADALAPLAQFGWTALHDVRWPGRRLANIDHIAIGPGGVVIIDAKNWTGNVTIKDGTLRQNGYSRAREVDGAYEAGAAVAMLLAPEVRGTIRSVICLAGQEHEPVDVGRGVIAIGRLQLARWLAGMPAQLNPYVVAGIGRHLYRHLGAPRSRSRRANRTRFRAPDNDGRRSIGVGRALLIIGLLMVLMILMLNVVSLLVR